MSILITGGAGFIGSNFILDWFATSDEAVVTVDKLTYAGNLENLQRLPKDKLHKFVKADIADSKVISELLDTYKIRAVVHFAAESHVDKSIAGPEEFIKTNVLGTFYLLEAVRKYWQNLQGDAYTNFRFLHVSTDEVFGTLTADEPGFTEKNPYLPNSPYSASKAASDHLVRAYFHTYGLPVLTTNCSNNYGPYQFPEKLIPICIDRALSGEHIPVYGDGKQIRDWLHVSDHCNALRMVLAQGRPGELYNIGSWNEKTNLEVVQTICDILDQEQAKADGTSYASQIAFVSDRPGHDKRYAIDANKIEQELHWKANTTFEAGIRDTVLWYLNNKQWVENIKTRSLRESVEI